MSKKILIIDDDPVVVKYLMAVFSDNGYATCSASSSMEGLDVVKKELAGYEWIRRLLMLGEYARFNGDMAESGIFIAAIFSHSRVICQL